MKKLNLKSIVDKTSGIPKSHFKEEYQKENENFCTLKEFIDNPDTVEQFRYNNQYLTHIKYNNEVYEYIDSFNFDKKECEKRKKQRNDNTKNQKNTY